MIPIKPKKNMTFGKVPFTDWANVLSKHGGVCKHFLWNIQNWNIVDNLVLSRREDIEYVEKYPKMYPNIFAPNIYTFDILDNHMEFIHWMQVFKLTEFIPKVYSDIEPIQFPCILKRNGRWNSGKGTSIIKFKREIKPGICQEIIYGDTEYTAHLALKNGVLLHSLIYKGKLPTEDHIKRTPFTEYEKVEHDISPILKILKDLNYTGICCPNYKIVDGVIKIFEINPRIGGSLIYSPDLEDFLNTVKSKLWWGEVCSGEKYVDVKNSRIVRKS